MRRLEVLILVAIGASLPRQPSRADEPIDRHALVTRHNITVHAPDPNGAMALGNGGFAFNFDITGLQTFPDYYAKTMPIGILSNWGWHRFPNPDGFSLDNYLMTTMARRDRPLVYPGTSLSNPSPAAAYLRGNTHRFGLGRIGLEMTKADGSAVTITDLKNIDQQLDLWNGHAASSFEVDGIPVRIQTAIHPARDEVGISVESPLIAAGRLKVRIAFPYALYSFGPEYQDWSKPEAHQTELIRHGTNAADFSRTLDDTHYFVRAKWSDDATLAETGPHQFLLSSSAPRIEMTAWFSPQPLDSEADSVAAVQSASSEHWQKYWSTGGAVDLSNNTDPRAAELERRIVLSQYIMAAQEAGSLPGQETGLADNSWFGKFHMEMYWWHAAHWPLWGRPEILEKSLQSLKQMMPPGQAMARREGCEGVKWSKMTDPSGIESPSSIGPVLVWQQPHPIYLAELLWRAHQDRATLEKYQDIVFQTADYMATFVDFDPERKQYILGPAVACADEKHPDFAHTINPTMELGYWKWGLETAQQWRTRLNLPRNEKWDDVIQHLAPLTVRDGVYPALELPEETKPSRMATWLFGVLRGRDVDRDVMRNTLRGVLDDARWRSQEDQTWGAAMVAMCAARLGEPETAVDLLVGNPPNESFRPSGYAIRRPQQTPMNMPANGGWLAAVAMMASGWDGNTEHAPGFPKNWKVRYEGLAPMP
jgi:hypothetical protein